MQPGCPDNNSTVGGDWVKTYDNFWWIILLDSNHSCMILEWGTYEVMTSCLGHWQKKQETPLETLCELFVMAMTNGRRYLETLRLFGGISRNLIWEALATYYDYKSLPVH